MNRSEKLDYAIKYIRCNKNKIVKEKRQTFHLMSQIGWCNDPNGFCYHNGKIHLFYQHNPFDTSWQPMHWGHAVSDDFIKWKYLPVALAPDKYYDDNLGCFSGSAISEDDKMYLFYTGVDKNNNQQQCVAESSDGVNFYKIKDNPVITSDSVKGIIDSKDFRDPFVFVYQNMYYCLTGVKHEKKANIALFSSKNKKNWNFVGFLFDEKKDSIICNDGVLECPSYAKIDGSEVLFFSPSVSMYSGDKYKNSQTVVYMIGKLDFTLGRFQYTNFNEVDYGTDFYASLLTIVPGGRVIMTAWQQLWGRTMPTSKYGWAGSMILPRELSVKDGKLYQSPVRELNSYLKNYVMIDSITVNDNFVSPPSLSSDVFKLCFKIKNISSQKTGIRLMCGKSNYTLLLIDYASGSIIFDRTNSGEVIEDKTCDPNIRKINYIGEELSFCIIADKTSLEIFIDNGKYTISSNVYPPEGCKDIQFFSEKGKSEISFIEKWDIVCE